MTEGETTRRDCTLLSAEPGFEVVGEATEFAKLAGRAPESPAPQAKLTPRENQVLDLIAHGKSNNEIAVALDIAESTVKNHMRNILEKLHLENRVQAAAFALGRKTSGRSPADQ